MVNAILLWAVINGAIGLVIFFGTTLIENLYELIKFKVKGIEPVYDWDKFKAIKINGNSKGALGVLLNILKTLVLPLIMFGAFYFLVQLNYWMFHQDFRFMLISAAPLNARMFVTAIEYIPILHPHLNAAAFPFASGNKKDQKMHKSCRSNPARSLFYFLTLPGRESISEIYTQRKLFCGMQGLKSNCY